MCVCLSVLIKIAEDYSQFNRSSDFSEMKKLHIREYGVMVDFSEFSDFIVELQKLYRQT